MSEDFRELRPPAGISALHPADRNGLFDFIRAQVTDEMLQTIARGNRDTLEALRDIRAGIDADRPIAAIPGDVLVAFRSRDFADRNTPSERRWLHVARAFCAGALLRAPDRYERRPLFDADSIGPLVESSLLLGRSFRLRLLSQLTWSLQTMEPDHENYLFFAFALLVAFARTQSVDEANQRPLESWMLATNRTLLAKTPNTRPEAQTFMEIQNGVSPDIWRQLADSVAPKLLEPETIAYVSLVATGGYETSPEDPVSGRLFPFS